MSDGAGPVYIALGSNQLDPQQQLLRAIKALHAHPHVAVARCSSLYRTPPWGMLQQPSFVNAVAQLHTTLDPESLLDALIDIENAAGRRRELRWGPRVLDLDLLVYGEQVIDTQRLYLPHPHLHQRAFVLIPLLDIAPDFVIPMHGRADQILATLDCNGIEKIG